MPGNKFNNNQHRFNQHLSLADKPLKNISAQKDAGFTLMEIIVAMGIFVILVTILINVFILTLQSQRQASFRQTSIANLRFTMETIARQIRTSEIDYNKLYDLDGATGIQDSENELHLLDADNNNFSYYLEPGPNGEVKIIVNGQVSSLTDPNEVKVVKLLFYIEPATDPFLVERCNVNADCSNTCTINDPISDKVGFCTCAAVSSNDSDCASNRCSADLICQPFDQQPRVTIVMGFESVATKPAERKIVNLQTTVSSRIYKR